MASSTKPILYSYFRSSCSWRVRIALAYKEIEYDYEPVNLLKNEQSTDKFKAVNPSGQVPALVHDKHTFSQSMSILEYLEEVFPQKPLLPKDAKLRAKVREICDIISGIQSLQNLSVLKKVGEEKKLEWAKFYINKGFAAVEKLLDSSGGKFCVGDNMTLADCFLVPQVYNANRFKVDMTAYPIISRINAQLGDHEAIKKSHPTSQPDCPDDLK